MLVSVVIPTLNEESCIGATLDAVAGVGGAAEVIVADGGSADRTAEIAAGRARVVTAPRGRGSQQAAGARAASGDVLWFLHADSVPRPGALTAIEAALADRAVGGGNFSLLFDGDRRSARQLTTIYPYLRFLGLCYGDSGIFVRRDLYEAVGGFRDHPLFEDIDLIRRIRRRARFVTLPEPLTTSSRRFENRNFGGMFAVWTGLQILYWVGVPPKRLAALYHPVRRS